MPVIPRFSRCEFCYHQTQQISDRSASLEEKLCAVKVYREHLHSQYCDRTVQWSLEEASRDPSSGILTILLDGMDQAKFRLPRHPGHRAVSSMILHFKLEKLLAFEQVFMWSKHVTPRSWHLTFCGFQKTIQGPMSYDHPWRSTERGQWVPWSVTFFGSAAYFSTALPLNLSR